jgi:hypothetical protein
MGGVPLGSLRTSASFALRMRRRIFSAEDAEVRRDRRENLKLRSPLKTPGPEANVLFFLLAR